MVAEIHGEGRSHTASTRKFRRDPIWRSNAKIVMALVGASSAKAAQAPHIRATAQLIRIDLLVAFAKARAYASLATVTVRNSLSTTLSDPHNQCWRAWQATVTERRTPEQCERFSAVDGVW